MKKQGFRGFRSRFRVKERRRPRPPRFFRIRSSSCGSGRSPRRCGCRPQHSIWHIRIGLLSGIISWSGPLSIRRRWCTAVYVNSLWRSLPRRGRRSPPSPRPRPRAARSAARASVRRGRGSKARRAAAAGATRSRTFRSRAALLRRNRAWSPETTLRLCGGMCRCRATASAADSGCPDPQPTLMENANGQESR